MFERVKELLQAPTFPEREKTQDAYLLNWVLWMMVLFPAPYMLAVALAIPSFLGEALLHTLIGETVNVILLRLMWRGHVRLAAFGQVGCFWLFLTGVALTHHGLKGPEPNIGYSVVIVITGVLLGWRVATFMTALCMISTTTLFQCHRFGYLWPSSDRELGDNWVVTMVLFPLVAALQHLSSYRARVALAVIEENTRAMRQHQQRLQTILSAVPGVVYQFHTTPDGKMDVPFFAGRMTEIFGLPGRMERPFEQFVAQITPEDRPRFLSSVLEVLVEPRPWHFEGRFNKPSGEQIWFRGLSYPQQTDTGVTFNGLLFDITAEKQSEELLRQSEEKFARIFFSNPLAVAIACRHDCTLLEVNPEWERVTGYSRGELVGLRHGAFCWWDPDRSRTCSHCFIDSNNELLEHEIYFRRKDGTQRVGSLSVRPITLNGDACQVILLQEITERRQSQDALRESEERFHSLFNNMMEGVALHELVFDDQGEPVNYRIVDVNPQYEKILELSRASVLGRLSTEVYPVKIPPVFEDYCTAALAKQPGRREVTVPEMGRIFDVSIIPWSNRGFATIFSDITERKQLQEQLLQSQKMESIGRLAAGVAHDFNNLLTAILGYANLLEADLPPDSPVSDWPREIRRAGERASALTRQLLIFGRKQLVSPVVVDLNQIVEGLQKMVIRVIGEDVCFVTRLTEQPLTVRIDPHQLEQVLMNLIVNARDAMPTGGMLTIETARLESLLVNGLASIKVPDSPHVLVRITDTGCGMDATTQAHIFEPFFTTKEVGKGSGLGLVTVYAIVKESHGTILVDSSPGQGATFTILLPAHLEDYSSNGQDETPSLPQRGSERILVVEDEEQVRKLVVLTLQNHGYSVLEANGPEEALQIGKEFPGTFNLVLTDLVMPNLSGRALAEQLSAMRPETHVVYMSGYTDDEILRHGLARADVDFLQKPFSPSELLAKVRQVLTRLSDPAS